MSKKKRKAEVMEGILENMETDGAAEDWKVQTLYTIILETQTNTVKNIVNFTQML